MILFIINILVIGVRPINSNWIIKQQIPCYFKRRSEGCRFLWVEWWWGDAFRSI